MSPGRAAGTRGWESRPTRSARSTRPRQPALSRGFRWVCRKVTDLRAGPPGGSGRARALPTRSMPVTLGTGRQPGPAARRRAATQCWGGRRRSSARARVRDVRLSRMPSVVIAAHNEAAVVGRCLDSLLPPDAPPDGLEVVVVANGCTDRTAEVARARGGRTRPRDGRGPARSPRWTSATRRCRRTRGIYLDADIVVTPATVQDLCAALTGPGAPLVAVPSRHLELAGRPLVVRAYYAVQRRLPVFDERPLRPRPGRAVPRGPDRFGTFPEQIADDLFLDSLFTGRGAGPAARARRTSVETPLRTRDLLDRLTRVRRGNAALRQRRRSARCRRPAVRPLVVAARRRGARVPGWRPPRSCTPPSRWWPSGGPGGPPASTTWGRDESSRAGGRVSTAASTCASTGSAHRLASSSRARTRTGSPTDAFHEVLDTVAGDPPGAAQLRRRQRLRRPRSALPALVERGLQRDLLRARRTARPARAASAATTSARSPAAGMGDRLARHGPRALAAPGRRHDAARARRGPRASWPRSSGLPVEEAALPLGRYDRRVLGLARRAGYAGVHTSDRCWSRDGAWLQPRFSARSGDDAETIRREVLSRAATTHRARSVAVRTLKRLR